MQPTAKVSINCNWNCARLCPRKSSCCSTEKEEGRIEKVVEESLKKEAEKTKKVALKQIPEEKKRGCIIC